MRSTASHSNAGALPTLLGRMGFLAMIVLVAGCASRTYSPTPLSEVGLTARAVAARKNKLRFQLEVR